MALDARLCETLTALLGRASSVLPAVGLGLFQHESAELAEFTYCGTSDTSLYRVGIHGLSDAVQPRPSGLRRLTAPDLEALSITLHDDGPTLLARQGMTLPVPHSDPAAILVVGLSDWEPLSPNQLVEVESLATHFG